MWCIIITFPSLSPVVVYSKGLQGIRHYESDEGEREGNSTNLENNSFFLSTVTPSDSLPILIWLRE